MSKTQSKKYSVYSSCSELPLKVFFKIAESGDVNLLVIDGEVDKDILIDLWEDIIIEFSKLDNNMAITNAIEKSNQIAVYAAQYLEIKAMLLYLKEVEYNQSYVDRLRELGYKVSEIDYVNTIDSANQRSNNIVTRVNILEKEVKEKNETNKITSFDSVMAWMMTNNVVGLTDDITVARYLEIKKQINERNKKIS